MQSKVKKLPLVEPTHACPSAQQPLLILNGLVHLTLLHRFHFVSLLLLLVPHHLLEGVSRQQISSSKINPWLPNAEPVGLAAKGHRGIAWVREPPGCDSPTVQLNLHEVTKKSLLYLYTPHDIHPANSQSGPSSVLGDAVPVLLQRAGVRPAGFTV